jgi:hypothetical protein
MRTNRERLNIAPLLQLDSLRNVSVETVVDASRIQNTTALTHGAHNSGDGSDVKQLFDPRRCVRSAQPPGNRPCRPRLYVRCDPELSTDGTRMLAPLGKSLILYTRTKWPPWTALPEESSGLLKKSLRGALGLQSGFNLLVIRRPTFSKTWPQRPSGAQVIV